MPVTLIRSGNVCKHILSTH